MPTRTYSIDKINELTTDKDTYVTSFTGQKLRWATEINYVFKDQDRLWMATFCEAATEGQEHYWREFSPGQVEAVEVEPYEKTVTRYRPVESDD